MTQHPAATAMSEDASQASAVPSVDVGLTAYRRATYIADAIESVLGQTFERWRLTVCDNGPGGGEIERVVQPYLSDPRVSYVATGRELSLAQNWTNALNQGTSAYAAVLNDDDRWHADYLRARVESLEAHPECGFAFGEWTSIDEHGTATMRNPTRFREGVLSRELMARHFVRRNLVVPPAVVVRRSAVEAVGAFFDDKWQYCDWEMWARLAARFPAYYLARQDCDFRRHAAAYTFRDRETPEHLLAMVDHIERLFMRGLDGFRLSRMTRARNRSLVLLQIASDAHQGGGWKTSYGLYLRALRSFPPTFFGYVSLRMIVRTLLGQRLSCVVAAALRPFRRRFAGRSLSRLD